MRDICTSADASVPMITHHFGSKQGLYDEIVGSFSSNILATPIRMIANTPSSKQDFTTRLELFISETFAALIAQAPVIRILTQDGGDFENLRDAHSELANFLRSAQDQGFVRASLDIEMVTGLIFDRLGNQIVFATNPAYGGPNVLTDEAFRKRWLAANISVLVSAFVGCQPTESE